jgi:hypothetical protein
MKGLLIKDQNSWKIKYVDRESFSAPLIEILTSSSYTGELPLSPEDTQYLEELKSVGDPQYERLIDYPYVDFDQTSDGFATLNITKKDSAWMIIEAEIRSAFIHGQGNARMMDAGLERDETEDHVNWIMSKLTKKYNPPTPKD